MSAAHSYFAALAGYSCDLMQRLPICEQIEPIAATFARLKPALDEGRPAEVARLAAFRRPAPERPHDPTPAGMNTVGILADRLAILVCKDWYLRYRQHRPAEADTVRLRQLPDIVTALALARPGHVRLLEKVSSLPNGGSVGSFEEAYYGILAANILMWETQEMLYTRDMDAVPTEELRDYIRFFSQANMLRNACIAHCETHYWES